MDKKFLLARMMELRLQLAEIDRKLKDLDQLLEGDPSDEDIHKYADGLLEIVEERDRIIAEARGLILMSRKEAPDIDKDGGAYIN